MTVGQKNQLITKKRPSSAKRKFFSLHPPLDVFSHNSFQFLQINRWLKRPKLPLVVRNPIAPNKWCKITVCRSANKMTNHSKPDQLFYHMSGRCTRDTVQKCSQPLKTMTQIACITRRLYTFGDAFIFSKDVNLADEILGTIPLAAISPNRITSSR